MVGSPLTPGGSISRLSYDILSKVSLEHKNVLDVGCGYGLLSSVCRHFGARDYLGVDITDSAVQEAHRLNPTEAYALGDAHLLPFADGTFAIVLCIDSLEHLLNPQDALREMYRVLQENGLLLISSPNYFNIAGLLKYTLEHLRLYPKNSFAPFLEWRKQELEQFLMVHSLRKMLKTAGFHVCCFEGAEIFDGLFPFMNLSNALFRNNVVQYLRRSSERFRNNRFMKHLGLHVFMLARR